MSSPPPAPNLSGLEDVDSVWLAILDKYRASGHVNEHMVNILEWQCAWASIHRQRPIYNATKLIFDRVLCLCGILLLSPLFLVVALAIVATSRGPIFYTQYRIGQYCRPFRIYKFRTMLLGSRRVHLYSDNDMSGGLFKRRKDPRLTAVGVILRRWSIDELPQLWNVVCGDMALVGPRPLTFEDTGTVPSDAYSRFAVRPGITGYWQATARSLADGQLKIRMDADYVDRRSWRFDLYLLARTVLTILRGTGAW